ncbi:hypothetical protein EYF80_051385 [Liparis tanakae]|uniref:Uncharacterized protein n=1 Tax=Liparis tanakae TaxID=230148 RepID=A0A4Z2FC41_9TELE|nr:hypothetical protein EYF80_051385 [Liparis tanakae]
MRKTPATMPPATSMNTPGEDRQVNILSHTWGGQTRSCLTPGEDRQAPVSHLPAMFSKDGLDRKFRSEDQPSPIPEFNRTPHENHMAEERLDPFNFLSHQLDSFHFLSH